MRRANYDAWIQMFTETMREGRKVFPRGSEIREIEDLQLTIDPMYPFMNFVHRKLNINYFKQEMLWKLTGDKFNNSILDKAKMWASVQNSDGSFNSNYGQYWFGPQQGVNKVVSELLFDEDSRRAVIPMLNDSHIGPHVNDTVCTECVGFRIRDGKLNMSVHMRSSDQIFGLGTDLPTFAFLQRIVLGLINPAYAGSLTLGTLSVTAMSSHIYSCHFNMVGQIIADESVAACSIMPLASAVEAGKLTMCRGKVNKSWGPLSNWLLTDE